MLKKERSKWWHILFFILTLCLPLIQADVFHYYKLKKLITAVAFARALSRRPTVLPIPIPIPIPIQQNEVIKIPSQSGKSVIALSGGNQHRASGVGGAIHGGSILSSIGKNFQGSSPFGYALPGISRLNGNKIFAMSPGNEMGMDNNIIGLPSFEDSNSNSLGGMSFADGLSNFANSGFEDIGSSAFDNAGISSNRVYSFNANHRRPSTMYFTRKKPRIRRPYAFGGRRTNSGIGINGFDSVNRNNQFIRTHYKPPQQVVYERHSPNIRYESADKPMAKKKPITVGEKYGWRQPS